VAEHRTAVISGEADDAVTYVALANIWIIINAPILEKMARVFEPYRKARPHSEF
jgi:hypothetical protein